MKGDYLQPSYELWMKCIFPLDNLHVLFMLEIFPFTLLQKMLHI